MATTATMDTAIEPTKLFPVNHLVDRENHTRLHGPDCSGEVRAFRAVDLGRAADLAYLVKSILAAETLELRVGAQVIYLVNCPNDKRLVNGARGVVTAFDLHGNPEVRFAHGETQAVPPHAFEFIPDARTGRVAASRRQIPLKLAWALSVHKAQVGPQRGYSISRKSSVSQQGPPSKRQRLVQLLPDVHQEPVAVLRSDEPHDARARVFVGAHHDPPHAFERHQVVATRRPLPSCCTHTGQHRITWCSTHRLLLQGMSIDLVEVYLDECFVAGQAYTALSRCTSLEGLRVHISPASISKICADPRVTEFEKTLE